MCLLGGSLTLLPIWGVKPPKTPIFGVWIGVFKPNGQNIESFMLSKLLHRFQPNLAQRYRPARGRRVWSQTAPNKSKMADGRHFEKTLNRHISATVWPILIDLVQWCILASYSGCTVKISNFWKSKIAAADVLKNHKYCDIYITVWPIFTKFGMLMQNGSINRSDR